jgi:hypothetical protein
MRSPAMAERRPSIIHQDFGTSCWRLPNQSIKHPQLLTTLVASMQTSAGLT